MSTLALPASPPAAPTLLGLVMGSRSDWATMQHAAQILEDFALPYETRLVSAHRTPDWLFEYAEGARERGLRAIIAGAGGAAHLPGMLAAKTIVPVLGVPVPSPHLHGQDSLFSIVQMPRGVPVATFAIGEAGAVNAALFAIALLARTDPLLEACLLAWRNRQTEVVLKMPAPNLEAGADPADTDLLHEASSSGLPGGGPDHPTKSWVENSAENRAESPARNPASISAILRGNV